MDRRRKAVFVAFHELIPGTTYVKPGESWAPQLRHAFDRTMDEVTSHYREAARSPRSDFISDLVNARDQGDKLSDRELFDQIFGICGASLSATSRRPAVPLYTLQHPAQLEQSIPTRRSFPTRSRMPSARQQWLFHFPAHRRARHRGRRHADSQGMVVRPSPLAPNYDPDVFPDPRASTFIASRSGYCSSVPARIIASITPPACARPSPSRSAACWRSFPKRRIPSIRTSTAPVYGGAAGELPPQSLPMKTH